MSKGETKASISVDHFWLAFALLIITCTGDPDLIDALIHFLMKGGA